MPNQFINHNQAVNLTIKRPINLTNPSHDLNAHYLEKLLNTSDNKLDAVDFRNLFNVNLPIGIYEEIRYFLPISFDYICDKNNTDQLEMLDEWLDFVFKYHKQIYTDYSLTLQNILDSLVDELMSDFIEVHMDKHQCVEKAWGINSFRYVEVYHIVENILDNANNYGEGKNWIKLLLIRLSQGNDLQKQWLKELEDECETLLCFY